MADSEKTLCQADRDLLHRIFRIGTKRDVSLKERKELVCIIESRITRLLSLSPLGNKKPRLRLCWGCAAFGLKTPGELAELFVRDFERMNVGSKSLGAFLNRERVEGYRSRIRGKLFHLLVRNFAPLQADFRRDASNQVKELNDPQLAKSFPPGVELPNWINAKGVEVPRLQKFRAPRRAENIRIIKKDGRAVEFVDDMFVSYADGVLGRLWTFLNEVEVKTSRAACRFAKQIGFAQLRLGAGEVKAVEMVVESFKERVRVTPERIIFSQRSIGRNAITLLSTRSWKCLSSDAQAGLMEAIDGGDVAEIYKRSDFRIQATTQQAHDSVFLRITLAIHAEYLNQFVQAIWPSLAE